MCVVSSVKCEKSKVLCVVCSLQYAMCSMQCEEAMSNWKYLVLNVQFVVWSMCSVCAGSDPSLTFEVVPKITKPRERES